MSHLPLVILDEPCYYYQLPRLDALRRRSESIRPRASQKVLMKGLEMTTGIPHAWQIGSILAVWGQHLQGVPQKCTHTLAAPSTQLFGFSLHNKLKGINDCSQAKLWNKEIHSKNVTGSMKTPMKRWHNFEGSFKQNHQSEFPSPVKCFQSSFFLCGACRCPLSSGRHLVDVFTLPRHH